MLLGVSITLSQLQEPHGALNQGASPVSWSWGASRGTWIQPRWDGDLLLQCSAPWWLRAVGTRR